MGNAVHVEATETGCFFFPRLIILLQYLLCFSLGLRKIIYIEKIDLTQW